MASSPDPKDELRLAKESASAARRDPPPPLKVTLTGGEEQGLEEPALNEEQELEVLLSRIRLTRWQRKKTFIVIALYQFFSGVEYAVILPSLWQYIQSFGETRTWWLGVVLTSFSIANMFASPFFGCVHPFCTPPSPQRP